MNSSLRIACFLVLLAACQGSKPAPAPSPSPAHAPAPAPRTAAEQIAHGGELYGANCAKCHGDAGEGSEKAPPLVGKGALPLDPRPDQKRAVKFHTALDVAQFVTANMPPKASDRAKLQPEDDWAILAFALNANGVALKEPAGPGNAGAIVLHP